jgi:hypothetical protein
MLLGAALALGACGPGEVGQDCQDSVANDCVDGAICTPDATMGPEAPNPPNADRFTCRPICDVEAGCADGFVCRSVLGSMSSSCQPDPDFVAPAPME